jgi:hypothetical protein
VPLHNTPIFLRDFEVSCANAGAANNIPIDNTRNNIQKCPRFAAVSAAPSMMHFGSRNVTLLGSFERIVWIPMDRLSQTLDSKLREWRPEIADQVRAKIAEIIELADHELLDVARPREIEQEVLDIIDAPPSR